MLIYFNKNIIDNTMAIKFGNLISNLNIKVYLLGSPFILANIMNIDDGNVNSITNNVNNSILFIGCFNCFN
jgi:hypothetical protein